jgi:hypothetical protein
MSHSDLLRFVTAIGAVVLAAGAVTLAQSTPADQPVKPAPDEVAVQSCWHPGLARNIGIAEPSCDAPMARAVRPGGSQKNEDAPGPAKPGAD